MRTLRSERRGAARGLAKSMVVFVHGYGAGGGDLMGLADHFIPYLPNTVFFAPDAPLPENNPQLVGRMWFPIPWIDGASEEVAYAGLIEASVDLNAFVDDQVREEGLAPSNIALVGFSQGAMLGLHISIRRSNAFAGVVSIAGRLLLPEVLARDTTSKPPVLLIHGDQDDVVPFDSMDMSKQALQDAGFSVRSHRMNETGHSISVDGLGATLGFLKNCFSD